MSNLSLCKSGLSVFENKLCMALGAITMGRMERRQTIKHAGVAHC